LDELLSLPDHRVTCFIPRSFAFFVSSPACHKESLNEAKAEYAKLQ
jgi:hypothetical protein